MAPVVLETHAMRVVVRPSFGARVISLVDKTTGRDWIAPGSESASPGEDAVYLGAEAVGWDECFPTVSPWDASSTPWQRTLRDHGDLWGRPWHVEAQSKTALTTRFAAREFDFIRALEIQGAQLQATYSVKSRAGSPLPWMWALHALLAVTPEDRVILTDIDHVEASFLDRKGQGISPRRLRWPGPSDDVPLALDRIHPAAAAFAGKLYASNLARCHALIGHEGSWLEIGWQMAETPHLGLWLNYGGWPQIGPAHHIAIEPTTAPVDHLGEAIRSKTARILEPGETHRWAVSLTIRHDPVLPTGSSSFGTNHRRPMKPAPNKRSLAQATAPRRLSYGRPSAKMAFGLSTKPGRMRFRISRPMSSVASVALPFIPPLWGASAYRE